MQKKDKTKIFALLSVVVVLLLTVIILAFLILRDRGPSRKASAPQTDLSEEEAASAVKRKDVPKGSGVIRGTVVDAAANREHGGVSGGLSGASVTAKNTQTEETLPAVTADADGSFEIIAPVGEYILIVEAENYPAFSFGHVITVEDQVESVGVDVVPVPQTDFETWFSQNPLDPRQAEAVDADPSTMGMAYAMNMWTDRWRMEVLWAYDRLIEAGAPDAAERKQEYLRTYWSELRAQSEAYPNSGGTADIVGHAALANDFYRDRAKALYEELFSYDPAYRYAYETDPETWFGLSHLDDGAALFSDEERQLLFTNLGNVSAQYDPAEFDVVIVTAGSPDGGDVQAAADDYYDNGGFAPNGILLMVCSDSREYAISTTGEAIDIFNDEVLQRIQDSVVSAYFSQGDYFNGCDSFLEIVDDVMHSR